MRASIIGDTRIAARTLRFDRKTGGISEASEPARWLGGSRLARGAMVISVLVVALLMLPAMAAPATYSGESRVADQSEGARAGALKTALAEVVIRLSGDPGILARDNVATAVAAADKYVLQYSYRRDTTMDDVSGVEKPQLVLVAEFDSTAVDRMLAGLGISGIGSTANIDATPVEKHIWLSGIHSAADYARGIGYLSRQPLVHQSWPVEARGDGILIRIELAGDFNRWLGLVDQDGVMQVNSASPPVQGIDATLALNP